MEKNYYFDQSDPLHPFTHEAEATPGTFPPVNALRIKPEIIEGYKPCEKSGEWVQVEDHRGKEVYSTSDASVHETVEILGSIADGYTLLKPDTPWSIWNGQGWQTGEAPVYTISKRQVKLVLAKGIMQGAALADVAQNISALSEFDLVRIEWEESTEFAKNNDFIQWLAESYSLDIDELFSKAGVL